MLVVIQQCQLELDFLPQSNMGGEHDWEGYPPFPLRGFCRKFFSSVAVAICLIRSLLIESHALRWLFTSAPASTEITVNGNSPIRSPVTASDQAGVGDHFIFTFF